MIKETAKPSDDFVDYCISRGGFGSREDVESAYNLVVNMLCESMDSLDD